MYHAKETHLHESSPQSQPARHTRPVRAHRAGEHGAVDGEERGAIDGAQQRLQRALHPRRQPPSLFVQEARLRVPELLARTVRAPQGPQKNKSVKHDMCQHAHVMTTGAPGSYRRTLDNELRRELTIARF